MIEDLGEDTITLAASVNDLGPNVQRMDTLIHLLSSSDVKNHGADLYYLGRKASRGNTVALHDRTIQQMKNSGGFRLISDEKTSKAILEYYNKLRFIDLRVATELNETNTRIGLTKAEEQMNLSAKNLIDLLKQKYNLK